VKIRCKVVRCLETRDEILCPTPRGKAVLVKREIYAAPIDEDGGTIWNQFQIPNFLGREPFLAGEDSAVGTEFFIEIRRADAPPEETTP
jgi:hypothetical protein